MPLKKILYLGVIPLMVGVFAILFKNAAGPYWLAFHIDPAYCYFFNYLYLLNGLPLYPTSHPGLTLDVLGALTIKMFHPTLIHQDLFRVVIKNPEFYLHALHNILVFLYVSSLVVLGWFTYKKSQDILMALLVQSSSLLILAVPSGDGDIILPVMAHVKPETLLATATNLLMIGLLALYWSNDARTVRKWALYLGAVCAFGFFTKYTFVLCLFLIFFILPGFTSRCFFILSFIIIGAFFYNVETDPYHRIFLWVKDLVLKSGYTGGMSDKFIESSSFIPALMELIKSNLFVFLTATLAWIVTTIAVVRNYHDKKNKKHIFLWLIAGCVGMQFLVVAKHPNSHYLVPAIGLCGLVLALLYDQYRHKCSSRIVALLILIFAAVNTVALIQYVKRLSENNEAMLKFEQGLSAQYPGYVICPYFEASSPVFALASETDNGHTYFNELLKNMYPDYFYYETNARDFKDFLSRWVPLSEIEAGHKGVLLYGNDVGEDFFKPYTIVREIEHTPQHEAVYAVLAQQSPHAEEFYQYSMFLYAQGKYEEALQFGLYARQLGFSGDMQDYLDQVLKQIKNRANH